MKMLRFNPKLRMTRISPEDAFVFPSIKKDRWGFGPCEEEHKHYYSSKTEEWRTLTHTLRPVDPLKAFWATPLSIHTVSCKDSNTLSFNDLNYCTVKKINHKAYDSSTIYCMDKTNTTINKQIWSKQGIVFLFFHMEKCITILFFCLFTKPWVSWT